MTSLSRKRSDAADVVIGKSLVELLLGCTDKNSCLAEMSRAIASYPAWSAHELDPTRIFEVLSEREALQSTGIGAGYAMPHAKLLGLEELLVGWFVPKSPIDFSSIDGMPTTVLVCMLVPENSGGAHLMALATMSRLARTASSESLCAIRSEHEFRDRLRLIDLETADRS